MLPDLTDILKLIHVIGATVLLGTGAGIAFFMLMAHRTGKPELIAHTASTVVIADTIFTATAVVAQPISGLWLASRTGWSWTEGWIVLSLGLYVLTGLFWLPVVWIQIRLRDLAADAAQAGTLLPERYSQLFRMWHSCIHSRHRHILADAHKAGHQTFLNCLLAPHRFYRLLRLDQSIVLVARTGNERIESRPELLAHIVAFCQDFMPRPRQRHETAGLEARREALQRSAIDHGIVCRGKHQRRRQDTAGIFRVGKFLDLCKRGIDPADCRIADSDMRCGGNDIVVAFVALRIERQAVVLKWPGQERRFAATGDERRSKAGEIQQFRREPCQAWKP